MGWYLHKVIFTNGQGKVKKSYQLKEAGAYLLGRESRCAVQVAQAQVSRCHAQLTLGCEGELTLVDTSANGSFVNGWRLPKGGRRALSEGDQISLGAPHASGVMLVVSREKTMKVERTVGGKRQQPRERGETRRKE